MRLGTAVTHDTKNNRVPGTKKKKTKKKKTKKTKKMKKTKTKKKKTKKKPPNSRHKRGTRTVTKRKTNAAVARAPVRRRGAGREASLDAMVDRFVDDVLDLVTRRVLSAVA